MRRETFKKLLYYLYSDRAPSVRPNDCIELVEVGNRLCLPRLVALVENEIVCEFSRLVLTGSDVAEDVLQLIEPAQVI